MAHKSKLTAQERFDAKTIRVGSGCLIWTGYKTERGYGHFYLNGRKMMAHRAAWILEHGELLSPDQLLLHSCDTPSCVEVSHLRVGTHEENMADVRAHGRHNMALGANHYRARFSDEDVERIRSMVKDGMLHREIAAVMGCSRSYVGLVVKGKVRSKPTASPSPYYDKDSEQAKAEARRTRLLEITRTRNRRTVHALICETWHGPRPEPGMHAAHINGDASDNRPENLRWATALENGNDRVRHGTTLVGSRNPASKLNDETVREIRRRLAEGEMTMRALAREYDVHPSAIRQLRDYKTWKHVA